MVTEHQHSGNKDRGLEEGRQAQPNDLLHPGYETVRVTSRYAEHIQTSHGDLNEQDTAPLQIGEEHFYYGVGCEDEAKKEHDWPHCSRADDCCPTALHKAL